MTNNDKQSEEFDNEYNTSDLTLAAFLIALGYPLLRVDGPSGGKRVFVFPAEATSDAPRFLQNAVIGAWTYANALRALKAQVRIG